MPCYAEVQLVSPDYIRPDNPNQPKAFSDIITNSPLMKEIFRYLEAVATTMKPVLITGETGVGKELISRAIHQFSRIGGGFVALNVAGLDDNQFADALFGHRKGAFTGALYPRGGLVKKADGGTLFLDEIGDLNHASQIKLLRLIENNEYFPLGSDIPEHAGIRIVAATNLSLNALRDPKQFRQDLYYRLHVHYIHIPPLRDRIEDLPLLINYFIKKAAQKQEKAAPTPPLELKHLLDRYFFPGNVRELESLLFDAVALCDPEFDSFVMNRIKARIEAEIKRMNQNATPVKGNVMSFDSSDPSNQTSTVHFSEVNEPYASWIQVQPLMEALCAIEVSNGNNSNKPWHRTLRDFSIDTICEFFALRNTTWFSRPEFALFLERNSKSGRNKYGTVGKYLSIFRENRIVEHNGKKANQSRYRLSPKFLDDH